MISEEPRPESISEKRSELPRLEIHEDISSVSISSKPKLSSGAARDFLGRGGKVGPCSNTGLSLRDTSGGLCPTTALLRARGLCLGGKARGGNGGGGISGSDLERVGLGTSGCFSLGQMG